MSWSGSSAPPRGPLAEFLSQPDHFLSASQPEHDREGPDPREGLIGTWPESPQPISLPRDISTGDSDTDKDRRDWMSMPGSWVGAWGCVRAESLLSPLKGGLGRLIL